MIPFRKVCKERKKNLGAQEASSNLENVCVASISKKEMNILLGVGVDGVKDQRKRRMDTWTFSFVL